MSFTKYEDIFRRSILFTSLYGMTIWLSMRTEIIVDPDLGWHLRTGQWIMDHLTVTTTDPFSIYGQGKSWVAYSWLFELLIYGLYRVFGLTGIFIYNVLLALTITLALQELLRKLETDAAKVIGLAGLGIAAMATLLSPRPWLFTILFFIIEFDLLLNARRTGNLRPLRWLPVLFIFWANIHVQFIYGFIPLGIFIIEPIIEKLFQRPFSFDEIKTSFNTRPWWLMLLSAIATLITPYHFKLYIPIIEYIQYTGAFRYISELQALDFRSPSHWLMPFLGLTAAFALGWRRQVNPFFLLLLLTGAVFAFRSGRDLWVLVIVSLIILATSSQSTEKPDRFVITKAQIIIVVVAIGLISFVIARNRGISDASLQARLAETYPVAAAQIVADRGYAGPLYNHFNWGGYLIWRLPHLPVSMDGRTNLHGDERIEQSLKTWEGTQGWASDLELQTARLVIADINKPLCSLLRFDQRFELVYEDSVAAVFIAHGSLPKKK